MAEKEKILVLLTACAYHNRQKTIKVEFVGVDITSLCKV